MKNILVVEDESFVREELVSILKKEGYNATEVTEFNDVAGKILNCNPDLVILDLNLPRESGFEICKKLKQLSSIPVLILTSFNELKDEIYALKLGADEYITKPFRKERLIVRIENILKRYKGRSNFIEREKFQLDKNTFTLYVNGKSTVLPQNQGKLLVAFLTSHKDVLTKDELSLCLWGTTEYIDENALQVNITRLKRVIKDTLPYLEVKSVRGIGYKVVEASEDEKQT